MKTNEIMELQDKHSIAGFKKRQLVITKGKGAILWDSEGNKYIDCVGGQGVANIGHAPKPIVDAINKQAKELIINPALFYNEQTALLLQKLSGLSGLGRGFLCNSGAEAVEAAIKFARVSTGKTEIIAAMRGFHGRTFGALAATWKKDYQKPFAPLVPGFKHVPFNKIEKLQEAVTDNTAAIILEVVQGEAGVYPADKEYLTAVRKLCDEKGILLIFDEVQTGFGRTGKMFAWQHYDIKPDMMTLAKSIAGGIPMGAVMCNEKVEVPTKLHANTFGGYPLTCAAALATLDFIEKEKLVENSAELGAYFVKELQKIKSDKIREVRGLGLFAALELKEPAGPFIAQFTEQGVLVLLTGRNILRFLPPLVIGKKEIDLVVKATQKVFGYTKLI